MIKIEAPTEVQIGEMYRIPKSMFAPDEIRMRKVELTLESEIDGTAMGFGPGSGPVKLYEEALNTFGVPRRWGFANYKDLPIVDRREEGNPVNMKFRGALRENQIEPAARLLKTVRETPWNGAILESPCGSGKTVLALKVAAELGRPTLVVVHKEFLMDQWKERIEEFLGIPASKIGHIQQDVCAYKNKSIVLGMIHSLAEKDYPEEMYSHFGTVIYDEVHRVGAPMFSQAVPKFPAKYRIGVSATPDRKDGLEKVFLWHIGDVIRGTGSWELKPTVYLIEYTSGVSQEWARGFRGNTNLGKLVTLISQDTKRNVWLAGEIRKAGVAGRKVLVLSDRLEHLETLRTMVKGQAPALLTSMYVGGLTGSERDRASGASVLFGTVQYAKEGLDLPELDTLYLATPHTDVEQMVGRILRTCATKKAPLVVDVADSMPITKAFANKRISFYMEQGFEVRRLRV